MSRSVSAQQDSFLSDICAFGEQRGGKEGEAAGLTACILVPEVLVAALSSGEVAVWGTSGAPENLEWGQP